MTPFSAIRRRPAMPCSARKARLLLPVLDCDRQCVEGVLELVDSLGLLLDPATQLLELGAGIRHVWPPSRWCPHLRVERSVGGLVPGSHCPRVGRNWPWVVRTARTPDPHAVRPTFVPWRPTLVQCRRSGVTVKREVAPDRTPATWGGLTVGQRMVPRDCGVSVSMVLTSAPNRRCMPGRNCGIPTISAGCRGVGAVDVSAVDTEP